MKIIRPNVTDFSADLIPQASGTLYMGTEALAWGNGVFDSLQVNTSPSGPLDVTTKQYVDTAVLGENLWDRTGTTLTTYFSADTVQMDGYVDWAGGNTWYLPIGADIDAFIASASCVDGDTIQLAAGTYTTTNTITVGKKVHIKGQGKGITTVTCATDLAATAMFDFTAGDDSMISDLTIEYTANNTASTPLTKWVVDGKVSNVDFIISGSDTGTTQPACVNVAAAKTVDVEDCSFLATKTSNGNWFVNGNTASSTINVRRCTAKTSGSVTATYGGVIIWTDVSSTVNVYDSTLVSTNAAADSGVIHCNNGTINVYNSTISGAGAGAFDVWRTAGTLTLYDTTLVNNTTSGVITYGGFNSTFKGGNIIYVPQGSGTNDHTLIESYIAKAKAGDTLVLAGGPNSSGADTDTYVIADDIDIPKSINVVGQGVGQTTIACATASKNVFDISASNVRIADLSISNTGGSGYGIYVRGATTGAEFENLSLSLSGEGGNFACYILNASATIRNCDLTVTSTDNQVVGIYGDNSSATTLVNAYDVHVTCDGGATGSRSFLISNGNTANTATLNLYNCTGTSLAAGALDYGLHVASTTTNNAYANAYGCTFNGADYDVVQTGTNTLTLYDTTLVNNTTSGVITYGGFNSTFKGGNIIYVPQGSGTNDHTLIESYIAKAKAGDTLVLAGGDNSSGAGTSTYVIADDIDVGVGINIVGQGVGKTTISCATASKNVFEITASNVRIANLSITATVSTAVPVYVNGTAGTVLSGIVIDNCSFTTTGTGNTDYVVRIEDASGTIDNCLISATTSGGYASGLEFKSLASTEAAITLTVKNTRITTVSTATISYPIQCRTDAGASINTMNLYNVSTSATGGGNRYGVICRRATSGTPTLNAYNCTFSGTTYDVFADALTSLTLYDTTLVNGTTSGTITYGGTVVGESFQAEPDSDTVGGIIASRAKMGMPTSGASDYAYFGHVDQFGSAAGYAVAQGSAGNTFINAVTTLSLQGGAASECVVNEASYDTDFRVESDGNANMLFVDGGTDNVYFNQNARAGSDDSVVQITATKSGNTGNLLLCDAAAMAQGVGGQLTLWGNYTGSTPTIASLIAAEKTNSTDGQYGFDTVVYTRINGVSSIVDSEVLRLGSTETVFNDDSCDIDFRVESANVDDAFKIDAGTDTASFGVDVELGNIEIEEDAGAVTLVNMAVSATPASGVEESYTFQIDDTDILKVYAEADGAGGIISQHTQMLGRTVSTNFQKILQVGALSIYVSDGTTAEGALTGVEGDICLNGGTGAGQCAYCDANGTNWTDM